jgi:AraC family transcriptional regulator, transcriptional activator of pobA
MMTVPHRAQFYNLLWIEKGKVSHYIDFNSIQIQDNTVLFIPMNSVNKFDIDGIYEGKAILFTL